MMTIHSLNRSLLTIGIAAVLLSGCKDNEDPAPVNDNELITTVRLTFTEQGSSGATPQVFEFKDLDGEGSNAPSKFDDIVLKKNTTYSMQIALLDESKTPVVDVSEEVAEEADEHLFVYTPLTTGLMTITITDKDANNLPIGLAATVVTGTTTSGQLKVQLRHQPPVNGQRVKDGTAGPGDDDLNLDFDVVLPQ